jgi:hypothetical protein
MTSANDFLPRLPKSATQEHRAVIEQAFHINANFEIERQKILNNRTLSDQGKRDAIAAMVKKDHAPQFRKLAEVVARHQVGAATARANLRPKPLDPAGEARRDQIRIWLRSLPAHERMKRALSDDETIRAAVMDAPSYLSGLRDDDHALIINQHIQKQFGAELLQLDDLDEIVANMDAALKVSRNEVFRSSNIAPHEFMTIFSPEEKAAA